LRHLQRLQAAALAPLLVVQAMLVAHVASLCHCVINYFLFSSVLTQVLYQAACCVGLFNLKQYFLWLLYSGIGVVVSVCGLVQRLVWDEASLSGSDWWLLLLTIALHAVFAPTCVIMLLQTFFGLVHNNTKIEIWERHWAVVDAQRRGDPAYQYPYERGTALGNVIEVFGTNPLAWWVPVYTGLVNGLDYGVLVPVNSNAPPAKAIQTV